MKQLMRRSMLAFLATSMVAGGLFAQGGKEAAPKAAANDASKYEVTAPIEITWWHALENQYQPLIDEIVNNFNTKQDKIKVKAEYIGNYSTVNETLVAAQAAGQGLPALVVANTPYVA